jgi:ribosomal protein S18 acetylase RimI-like enzyme
MTYKLINASSKDKEKLINYNINKELPSYKLISLNNNIIGGVLVRKIDDGVLLDDIYIEENYRQKGIGTSIIEDIITNNKIVYLWVYKNNNKAFSLYKKLGFIIEEETPTRYYMKNTTSFMI